jgi:hypothetical protein
MEYRPMAISFYILLGLVSLLAFINAIIKKNKSGYLVLGIITCIAFIVLLTLAMTTDTIPELKPES